MDSSNLSGLIGGVVAVILCTIFIKFAKRQETDGTLYHGKLILVLFIVCLAITLFAFGAFFFDENIYAQKSERYSVIGLVIGFGLATIYSYGEYFKVRGTFNNEGIEFHTPWTGTKKEKWENLVSANFNAAMYWYLLEFQSGAKVRLSSYVIGHGQVLGILKDRGYDV